MKTNNTPSSFASSPPSSFLIPRSSLSPPSSFLIPRSSLSLGFTLVELLVTITIIGILAGMVMGALHAAREYSKEAATKATIVKLNNIVMERYESYMTRRVPINPRFDAVNNVTLKPSQAAEVRVAAIRDLMRMEMPERWDDVIHDPIVLQYSRLALKDTNYDKQVPAPALKLQYFQRYATAVSNAVSNKGLGTDAAKGLVAENGGPECLYMQVAMGTPEAMEQFNQSEIGDTDGDTLPEFLDGWGRPISFLRWAPGFNNSDIQPNIMDWSSDAERANARDNDHDPFDSRNVDQTDSVAPHLPTGWRLLPLIYSVGPDGIDGLVAGQDFVYQGNPYETLLSPPVGIGTPKEEKTHYDNITNHHIEQR